MKRILLFAFILSALCDTIPLQIHLAFTGDSSQMRVSWVTTSETESRVQYGMQPNELSEEVQGNYDYYYLPLYESPALHTAVMKGLKLDSIYYYRVGGDADWSPVLSFSTESTAPVSESSPLRIAVFADVGATPNSQMVINAMKADHEKNPFHYLVLPGDLSYANGIYQYLWDDWGNMIEPLASQFPFMVGPGNHEALSLFIAYNYRYIMPDNGEDSLYYSFNYRNTHVITLNSESLNEFHWSAMYQWTKADLQKVDRSVTPWVFVQFHHPWYCSNANHQNSSWFMKEEYEDLFHQYDVDIVIQGHVHAYERTNGIYDWVLNKDATVYVTVGNAGNGEGLYKNWVQPQPSWSAYRESVFGYSTMDIMNSTHLHWRMVRAVDSVVRDEAWIVRKR